MREEAQEGASRRKELEMRRLGLVVAALALAFSPAASARAAGGPLPVVHATWADTFLSPGGQGLFDVEAKSIGDEALGSGFTIVDQLPAGVHATEVNWEKNYSSGGVGTTGTETCTGNGTAGPANPHGIAGATTVTCRLDDFDAAMGLGQAAGVQGGELQPEPNGQVAFPLPIWIFAAVEPGVGPGTLATNTATVLDPLTVSTVKDGGGGSNEAQTVTVKASAGQYELTATTAQGTGTLADGKVTGLSNAFGAFHPGDAVTGPGIVSGRGRGDIQAGSPVVSYACAFHNSYMHVFKHSSFKVGQTVSAPDIPSGATIVKVESSAPPPGPENCNPWYKLTLSAPATGNGQRGLLAETTVKKVVSASEIELSNAAAENGVQTTLSATETTGPIGWNAPATGAGSLATALEALPGIGAGNVTVTGGPGNAAGSGPYEIVFAGPLGDVNVPQMVGDSAQTPLAGGTPDFTDSQPVTFSPTPAPFGIVPGSFLADVFEGQFPFGAPSRQAGAHPFEQRVKFDLNRRPNAEKTIAIPSGLLRTVEVTLPPGMVGNPEAVPKCDPTAFAEQGPNLSTTGCPSDTQVGYVSVPVANTLTIARVPIYNLKPPYGSLVDFGFQVGGYVQGHIYATLDPAHDYAIKTLTPEIGALIAPLGAEVTIWGVPADPAHDFFRAYTKPKPTGELDDEGKEIQNIAGAPWGTAPIRPFFTNPTDCGVSNGGARIRMQSYEHPDEWTQTVEGTSDEVTGCEDPRFRFEPDIGLEPTDRHAGAPTGLDVKLKVPQRNDEVQNAQELYAQNGNVKAIATPPIKKTVVTLPEGMTLNPSAGQGLGGCSLEQLGMSAAGVPNGEPVRCPPDSAIGTLILHSPDLPITEPLTGRVFIARQGENPFGSLFALYLVLENPERGVLVKLAGKIELDPHTGQIKTTFDDLPQFPVSDLQLIFKGGIRAALVNPLTCGPKTITAEYYSWQEPNTPRVTHDSYQVTQRPDGSPCVHDPAERPYAPQFSAGTANPIGGAFSPFTMHLTRTDEDQEISNLSLTLPDGLLAKLTGVEQCPQANIAQAENPNRTGAEEQADPSCPAGSQIGSVLVGTGTGSSLTWVPGNVYFAGPYKNAPFSLVVITPSVVGPYDLGTVVVRSALYIDPATSQATVVSDPFPQILKGIPVRIRDVRVTIDRPQFMFNPTDCTELHITGGSSSAYGANATLSDRFQAANCATLGFKPKFTASTSGRTSRRSGASLDVKVAYPKAPWGTQADIRSVKVSLPRQLPSRLETLQKGCLDSVFDSNPAACPLASRVGVAVVHTPVLPVPLTGPAYFVSHGAREFPDLVIVLQGDGVTVDLRGETHISKKGITSTTYRSVPDVPFESFELNLPQGPYSALTSNGNPCKTKGGLKMPTILNAQNGMQIKQATKIAVTGCPKPKKRPHGHRRKRKR
jgi:hypothetical protein